MLDTLREIAPLATWGWTLLSALLLLLGFVAFAHAKLVRQAHYARFHGGAAPFVLETMMRWTVVLVVGGLLAWGIALEWPFALRAALGTVVAATLLLEALARLRGAARDGVRSRGGLQSESSSTE